MEEVQSSLRVVFVFVASYTLGARGFLREEPRNAISEAVKREKIDKR